MSRALAIASVTAVLKHLLENGLVDHDLTVNLGSEAIVSALPPDRITTGADERPQLNLFLRQMTPHTGLRSSGQLSGSESEHQQRSTEPFAFDLHYLLTAYGAGAVLSALGHAFFSLSLGMGAVMVYGSYLQPHVSIARTTLYVAIADTAVGLLVGLAIFALVTALSATERACKL